MSIQTSRTRRQSGKASALVPEEEDEGGEVFASTSVLHHSASSSSSGVALHLRHHWRRKRRQVSTSVGIRKSISVLSYISFLRWEDSLNERYPHIVYEEYSAGSINDKCVTDSLTKCDCDMIEEMLVMGLTRLSWERVDVSIQRFTAHSVIQVKDPFEHSEGADVIQHMIDHFLI
ncbi:unnamed protein product [Musa acuminata subsp. malaccensis]|uniref:(wild Malaysian banana) hypothetical protein n=1 Tax=Musa acuminata subsp. malaccensis TaxID=214687 RepID=A0A804I2J2_MUSAM|nr:unnamed protein product [Musa acuminata subsp. malaccensis]